MREKLYALFQSEAEKSERLYEQLTHPMWEEQEQITKTLCEAKWGGQ